MRLEDLGFSEHFAAQLQDEERAALAEADPPLRLARVSFISRDRPHVVGPGFEHAPIALLPGPLFKPEDPVLVGDWVLVDPRTDPPLVVRRL